MTDIQTDCFGVSRIVKRTHRYRLAITINGQERSYVTYAVGLAEAVARADGWVHKHFPKQWPTISCHRSPYGDDRTAIEHGAILPMD